MDAELENVLDGLVGGNDVVGVMIVDKTGEVIGARGDMNGLSAAEILQYDQEAKADQSVSAYKHGPQRLLLRREGDILIAILKNNSARRFSNTPSSR